MRHTQAGSACKTWIASLALASVLVPAMLCAQDLTIVNSTDANGRQMQTKQYISALGTRATSGDGTEIIVRVDQKKMYVLHPAQKTYSEMTFDEMQKMASSAASAMENMPPEAAAQMKKMMGAMGPTTVTVTHVGPGETIAGYATEKYHVVLGALMEGDIWATPALTFPPVFYDAMKAAAPSTPMLDMKKVYEEYKKIKGIPLKSVSKTKMMGREMTSTTLVTSVNKSAIPPATFAVPAGYKLVPMTTPMK
jgi:hypothetical protein